MERTVFIGETDYHDGKFIPNALVRAVVSTASPISSVDNRIVDHTITTEFSSPLGIENVEPNTMPSSTSSGTS
jgi:hypothetical protein